MKRTLFFILWAAWLFAPAAWAYDFVADGIYYKFRYPSSDKTVEVTYYSSDNRGYSGDVIIPETVSYNGTVYSVTAIGSFTFDNCTELTSVTIPESVTAIDMYAFWGCSGLTEITIPNSVTAIGLCTFYRCTGLTSVTIPESVISIGESTFQSCTNLTEVTIGAGVTTIGERAFYGCKSLTEITIPESVTAIGECAFASCDNLKSFMGKFTSKDHHCLVVRDTLITFASDGLIEYTIPDNVKVIGYEAFSSCTNISSVTIPENVTTICDRAFYQCDSLKSVTIGNGVTTIGEDAFYSCDKLTSVTIGNGVTTIGEDAFNSCRKLTSVTIGSSVSSVGSWAFWNCWDLNVVHISDLDAWWHIEFANAYSNPLYYAHNLYLNGSPVTELTIPEDITTIDNRFWNCTSITSVTIPERITTIKSGTFSGCTGLQKFEGKFASDNGRCLVVNDTLVAFALSGLSSYTTPDNITAIGDSAFLGCDIKSITVSDNVTAIGDGAFSYCDSLESATIGSGVTAIGKIIFECSNNITSITIYNPKQIKIDDVAFCEITDITFYVPEEAVEACKANKAFLFNMNTILPIVAYDFDAAPTMTPVENDKTVTSLSTFTLTFDERPVLVNDSATVMKADSSAFYPARITESDDGKSFIIVLQGDKQTRSAEYTLTEAGTYLLVIPAGTFGDDAFAADPNTGHGNPELVYSYTVKEPAVQDFVPTDVIPTDNSEVEALKTFVLAFDETPSLVKTEATLTKGVDSYSATLAAGDGNTLVVTLADTLKTAGEYTLTIPEGSFGNALFASDPVTGRCNPELVYTFTIKEPQPAEPDVPDVPIVPDEPVVPDEPDVPENPDEPDTPDVPDVPDIPDAPENPENPDEPDVPSEPENPDTPDTPDVPDVPDVPDEPENPDEPDEPENPVVPDEPDEPASVTETPTDAEHITVYTLHGVPVLETNDAAALRTLPAGTYIVNGKKMIITR